jgi:prepilin-type N-terminal cleavage/methylation domain-containing protein
MNFSRHRNGFTLVELIIVIVIIGVMAMVVGPTFTSGSDIARVKTASRGLMQMSRYARTMALLHQTPVDLVFSADGSLRVAAAGGGGGESLVSAKAFSVTNAAAESAAAQEAAGAEAEDKAAEESGFGGGSTYVMADLAVDKKYEQISFVFQEYTDSMDSDRRSQHSAAVKEADAEGAEGDVQTARVRYKSNGTCRPFRVRVMAEGTESFAMTVAVDLLGAAKIEEEDE